MSIHILLKFIEFQNTVQLHHWHTKSYAKHKASDQLLGALHTCIDRFVEAYIGKYGRVKPMKQTATIMILNDNNMHTYLSSTIRMFLIDELPKHLNQSDTDLYSIRDEILENINTTLYLWSLE